MFDLWITRMLKDVLFALSLLPCWRSPHSLHTGKLQIFSELSVRPKHFEKTCTLRTYTHTPCMPPTDPWQLPDKAGRLDSVDKWVFLFTLDDVCVWRAWMWCGVMSVSPICAYVRAREKTSVGLCASVNGLSLWLSSPSFFFPNLYMSVICYTICLCAEGLCSRFCSIWVCFSYIVSMCFCALVLCSSWQLTIMWSPNDY